MASIGYQRPVQKQQHVGELALLLRTKEEEEEAKEGGGMRVTKVGMPTPSLDAFILRGVMSPAECDRLVESTEKLRYSFWNASDPERKDFRNADTVEVLDTELAARLWERIREHVVPEVHIAEDEPRWERGLQGTWKAVGVNPVLLFARYGPGGHFSPHTDGYTILDLNRRSLYTLLFYLNTCPKGGATRMFMPSEDDGERHYGEDSAGRMRWAEENVAGLAPVVAGSVLAFYQNIPHEGEPVGEGSTKYIIRTDIMYERTEFVCTGEQDQQAYALFREAELLEAEGQTDRAAALFRKCVKLSPALASLFGM